MNHFHVLITAGREIDHTSRFYLLEVGSTMQANRDYLFVLAWAENHGYYFHIKDADTMEFLNHVAASLYPSAKFPLSEIQAKRMKIRDFVRSIKTHTAQPLNQSLIDSQNHLLNELNTNYHLKINYSKRSTQISR